MTTQTALTAHDLHVLRTLGEWKAEAAASSRTRETSDAWLAHDAGAPERRVMVLAEVDYLTDPVQAVNQRDLRCEDPWARAVEFGLRLHQYQYEVLRDDHVVSPFIEHAPVIHRSDFGVPSGIHKEASADTLAFNYQAALHELDETDFARLRHRTFRWDREAEKRTQQRLETIFNGILPVRRRESQWQFHSPITSIAFELVGLEQFMVLMYDNPEGLHRLMAFIRDDQLAYFDWLEAEGALPLNNEADYVGAGSMGYTRDLPQPDFAGKVRTKDRWFVSESQESVSISPAQYAEFVFPYLKALALRFGKVYYGCCEPVHPLFDCLALLPNLARVSVSRWADQIQTARFCRERGVAFSRKPSPNLLSGPAVDEGEVRAHIAETIDAARGCRLEIIQRDVYTTFNHPERFPRWVEIVREAAGLWSANL